METLTKPPHRTGWPTVFLLAGLFFSITLLLSLNRHFSLFTGFDQGLFNQIFWNNLRGNWFESTLSANHSIDTFQGLPPLINYSHLGQHFVPNFLLYLPIYALFPSPITLTVLQVILMTLGGLILYPLARHYLPITPSILIVASYYGANPILGPTLDNFYEQSQFPVFIFGLLLACVKRRFFLFFLLSLLTLTIREDAGVTLFGIGLYLAFNRKSWQFGVGLCLISFAYVTAVTNWIMPAFSDDNSKLYLTSFFQEFVTSENPSTLELLWGIISQPHKILQIFFSDIGKRLRYLLGLVLPLGFLPVVSLPAWVMSFPPLLTILIQSGSTTVFAITKRFTLGVMPLLIYGVILGLNHRQQQSDFALDFKSLLLPTKAKRLPPNSPPSAPLKISPRFQRFWISCIVLSLIFTITVNPHRSLYFLVPSSLNPFTYASPFTQWRYYQSAQSLIAQIPPEATVATNAYLVPSLSSRRVVVRLPFLIYRNEQLEITPVDYAVVNLWQLTKPKLYAPVDRDRLRESLPVLNQMLTENIFGVIAQQDGIFLFQRGVPSDPQTLQTWQTWQTTQIRPD